MNWYEEDEFEKNRKQEIKDGSYLDDGCVEVTCVYCRTKRAIVSSACCEKARKDWDDHTRRLLSEIIKGKESHETN